MNRVLCCGYLISHCHNNAITYIDRIFTRQTLSSFQLFAIFSAVLRIFTTSSFMCDIVNKSSLLQYHMLCVMCMLAWIERNERSAFDVNGIYKKMNTFVGMPIVYIDTHSFWDSQSMMYNNRLNKVNLIEMVCSLGNTFTISCAVPSSLYFHHFTWNR